MAAVKLKGKTKISIDYTKCGSRVGFDPRECVKCLDVCPDWVMVLQPDMEAEQDLSDPKDWRISTVWSSVCTRCMACTEVCPQDAITISW
ncbi:MAG: 4Fe-4S dicluster domain-containing protein [Candidatus Thorarchaeota archaeon]|jgi:formate hydrogenlyase subunit 6/NADH:ubiquinone oxidoreductase subunit I